MEGSGRKVRVQIARGRAEINASLDCEAGNRERARRHHFTSFSLEKHVHTCRTQNCARARAYKGEREREREREDIHGKMQFGNWKCFARL